MPAFICTACGTLYPDSSAPRAECPVCEEERQYVPPEGQRWTTLDKLRVDHANSFHEHELGIIGIGTKPSFAIGQRALLVQTAGGNILWDCIALVDDATVRLINGLGGIKAIAISHPHFYTTNMEWSRAFGNVPVHLHEADEKWIMNPHGNIRLWRGETNKLWDGLTLIRCGGHFPGGAVLHWREGASGGGTICAGDIVTVTVDRKFVSFMRSYPNMIPLSAPEVEKIGAALEPFAFDNIYSHYFDRTIQGNAKDIVRRSVRRYIDAITGNRDHS